MAVISEPVDKVPIIPEPHPSGFQKLVAKTPAEPTANAKAPDDADFNVFTSSASDEFFTAIVLSCLSIAGSSSDLVYTTVTFDIHVPLIDS